MASDAKMEVKSLISIKTTIDYENSGHLWYKLSQICLQKLKGPCQISSYFWVFWGKIQLSNGHKVSWFWVGWKILLDLIFPHVGLSSMPFWSKYTDPPTSMICGINFFKMLTKFWVYYVFNRFSLVNFFTNLKRESKVWFPGQKSPKSTTLFQTLSKFIWLFSSSMLLCNVYTKFKLMIKWFWRNFAWSSPQIFCFFVEY